MKKGARLVAAPPAARRRGRTVVLQAVPGAGLPLTGPGYLPAAPCAGVFAC